MASVHFNSCSGGTLQSAPSSTPLKYPQQKVAQKVSQTASTQFASRAEHLDALVLERARIKFLLNNELQKILETAVRKLEEGNSADFLSIINDVLETERQFIPALLLRANYYAHLGLYDHAINDLNQVLATDLKNFQAYMLKGRIYYRTAQWPLCLTMYTLALDIIPTNYEALHITAKIHLSLSNFSTAETIFQSILRFYPEDSNAQSGLRLAQEGPG